MLNKIKKKIKSFLIAISYGLKNTEADILGQKTTMSESNSIEQKMQMNELAESLLKGEVTEQVEMLRDRVYLISDESKKYKVVIDTVGTTKAFKKMTGKQQPKAFNQLDYSIDIVMDNKPISSGVLEGLQSTGGYGIKTNYPLNFEYKNAPKFKLENYVKRIVVRKNSIDGSLRIDLYVPKFTDSFERLEKIFDAEIIKVLNGKTKPFNLDFDTVSFISENAYGTEDLIKHEFKFKQFIGVGEFDGKHILIYDAESNIEKEKITEKYKNKKLRDNYAKKKSRGTKLNLGETKATKCYCEKCNSEMNEYDFRITKQTIGSGICKDCLIEVKKDKK